MFFFALHCAMFDLKKKTQARSQNANVKFSGHFFLRTPRVSEKNCPENKVTLNSPRCFLVHGKQCSTLNPKISRQSRTPDVKFSRHLCFGHPLLSEKKCPENLTAWNSQAQALRTEGIKGKVLLYAITYHFKHSPS